jgi:hypothetical protein
MKRAADSPFAHRGNAMARVWFLTIVLTALLPACTAQEPQSSASGWKAMIETREAPHASEKESTPDCLRKASVIEAWDCASKN